MAVLHIIAMEGRAYDKLGFPLPSDDERKRIIELARKTWKNDNRREHYVQRWLRAHRYAHGEHFSLPYTFRSAGLSSAERSLIENRIRRTGVTIEEGLRIRRTFVGKMYSSITLPEVTAINDHDEKSRHGAQRAQMALNYHYNRIRLEEVLRLVADYACVFGTGATKLVWDSESGRRYNERNTSMITYEGDLSVEAVSPLEIRVNEGATSEDNLATILHSWSMPVELVKQRYSEVDGIDKVTSEQHYELDGLTNIMGRSDYDDYSVLHEYYHRAIIDGITGWWKVLYAGDIILRDVQWIPFLPFSFFHVNKAEHNFWGRGMIEPVIELLQELDRWFTQFMAKMQNCVNRYAFDRNNQGAVEGFDDIEGGKVYYDSVEGQPPSTLPGMSYDGAFGMARDVYRTQMDNVLGITPQLEGHRGGTTSGVQYRMQVEQSETGLNEGFLDFRTLQEHTALLLLRAMVINYGDDEDRYRRIYGSSWSPDISRVVRDGVNGSFTVRIRRIQGMPLDPQQVRVRVMEEYQTGLYGQPNSPEAVSTAMSLLYSDSEAMLSKKSVRRAHAERQRERMRTAVSQFDAERHRYEREIMLYEKELADNEVAYLKLLTEASQYGSTVPVRITESMSPVQPVEPDWQAIYDGHEYDPHFEHYEIEEEVVLSPEFDRWPEKAREAVLVGLDHHRAAINPQEFFGERQ